MVARTSLTDPAPRSRQRSIAGVALLLPLFVLVPISLVTRLAHATTPARELSVVDAPRLPPLAPLTTVVETTSEPLAVSATPTVTVRGGTHEQHERLDVALGRFADAGLLLPDLEVVFSETDDACEGNMGLFEDRYTPWRVSFCSGLDFVYEHELAHAWEAAALSHEQREAFMALRGRTVWADHSVPWKERGIEDVAFVVQQALSGSPLPSKLSDEQLSRLKAFEFLAGFPDPRLADWEARAEPELLDSAAPRGGRPSALITSRAYGR